MSKNRSTEFEKSIGRIRSITIQNYMIYGLFLLCLLSTFIFFCPASHAGEQEGLIAYWNFDEGQGNTVNDKGPSKLCGTAIGTQWVKGKSGSALFFPDNKESKPSVVIKESKGIQLGNEFTVQVWIKPAKVDRKCRFEIINKGTLKGPGFQMAIDFETISFWSGNGTKRHIISSDRNKTEIKTDMWQHITVTFKNGILKLYLDGKKLVEKPEEFLDSNLYPITIGAYLTGRHNNFIGAIDEIKIYGRAKDDMEILNDAHK